MQWVNRFSYIAAERPALAAQLGGSAEYPDIKGLISVFWLDEGVYLQAEINGLPRERVLGFHAHEGVICGSSPFNEAGEHLSLCPEGTWCSRHPYHAGDFPPIFSDSNGYAEMSVYLDKVNISDLSGKTVILHSMPDDFTSQPSGNSGVRIACGIFEEVL